MTHKALEEYFHSIINKPVKEHLMFSTAQGYLAILKERFTSLWSQPVIFAPEEKETHMDEDYWAFEMVTHKWLDESGEWRPLKHTIVIEPHETTWMGVLDRILDEMEKHYGYSIKEQVYYSVQYPLNEVDDRDRKPFAGYGRSLNDNILQQLLLAFPEVYETLPYPHKPKNVFE